jgi:ribosomal protein L7/L12
MRGRLEINDNVSYKIMLIKYVRNITGCGLREAKDFVEGNGTLENLTHDMHQQLGKLFGWNYKYQSAEWTTFHE